MDLYNYLINNPNFGILISQIMLLLCAFNMNDEYKNGIVLTIILNICFLLFTIYNTYNTYNKTNEINKINN